MNLLPTVTFFGAIVVGLIALTAILLAFGRGERPAASASLYLYEMLRSQGDGVARLAIASGGRSFALAVRQCLRCPNTARCREWLDAGRREGYGEFCGNAGYVLRMRGLAPWTRT